MPGTSVESRLYSWIKDYANDSEVLHSMKSINVAPAKLGDPVPPPLVTECSILNGYMKFEGVNYQKSFKVKIYDTQSHASKPPAWTMTNDDWKTFWGYCENTHSYFTESTYANVKKYDKWKQANGVCKRPIYYENGNGVAEPVDVDETIVCRNCKIVLPLEAITIDHQRPQIGGGPAAIWKMLRAMGLTIPQYTAHGKKAKAFAGRFNLNFSTNPNNGGFNWAGVLFYTIIKRAGLMSDFQDICMHHAINLAPLCFRCNAAKGNIGYAATFS